jgi:hypothetical protein
MDSICKPTQSEENWYDEIITDWNFLEEFLIYLKDKKHINYVNQISVISKIISEDYMEIIENVHTCVINNNFYKTLENNIDTLLLCDVTNFLNFLIYMEFLKI